MNIPAKTREIALEYAKELVSDQKNPDVLPYHRLWQVAKKLHVSEIKPGATRTQGFLKRLDDDTYGVYYSGDSPKVRRRYTVAHELAHLVLEKFCPHINPEKTIARQGTRDTVVERVVDRIAAELLLPEHLFVEALCQECKKELPRGPHIDKFSVLSRTKFRLGVSESALAFRLIEIPQLLSVIYRIMLPDAPRHLQKRILQISKHSNLNVTADLRSIVDHLPIDPSFIPKLNSVKSKHQILIDSEFGARSLRCHGWLRQLPFKNQKYHEYWIVGWTWSASTIPDYDDSILV